jgi:ankyrin repeat protein
VACEVGLPLAVIQALVQADPSTVQAVTHKNDTPLSLACANTHHDFSRETAELLLSEYPKAALVANDYGYLPLHSSVRAYQPHRAIISALVHTAPQTLTATTHGGETALHLLANNTSASLTLWHELQNALKKYSSTLSTTPETVTPKNGPRTNTTGVGPIQPTKLGNTPLHNACFRGATFEQLEGLAIHHPSWLNTANAAGHTPLQILCKSGHVNAEKITLFSRLGGPGLFSMEDETGNTPLHSALRSETELSALLTLIQACPRALHVKTFYDDTPLHLACLRRLPADVVHAVAVAACCGMEATLAHCDQRISPILLANTAGQTPVAIAIEEYQKSVGVSSACSSSSSLRGDQQRAFDVLATLVKLLHYGPGTKEETERQNLVFACLCLHRKNVRLPPAFIRRVLRQVPEQVGQMDEDGNYPLHVEAGIPMEKMSLLDALWPRCCDGECARRAGILRLLLDIYPQAASQRNSAGYFPLALMVQNGRSWDSTFTWLLRVHPQAFHWVDGVAPQTVPHIIARYVVLSILSKPFFPLLRKGAHSSSLFLLSCSVGEKCGRETLFMLLKSRPDIMFAEANV